MVLLTQILNDSKGMLWLDIEGTQYWTGDQGTNRAFFSELVNEANALGVHLGVYSSASQVCAIEYYYLKRLVEPNLWRLGWRFKCSIVVR